MIDGRQSSPEIAKKTIFAALHILNENGGDMPGRDVIAAVEKRVRLDDWARERFEKTGYIRWQSILHFYTINAVKAGFLLKKQGRWYITPEGVSALSLGEDELIRTMNAKYRAWRNQNATAEESTDMEDPVVDDEAHERELAVDEMGERALEGIKKYILAKGPYEFQDLAAALLRAMGYFTPFIAPRGKDGGVDIVAYRDPLGTQAPRIKVQIKHRGAATPTKDLRELLGLLQRDGDVGIFFSSGGFTPDAKTTARGSHVHVELIDLERFIVLWQEFYDKLTDEDKTLLPLTPIYFLAPNP
jgi:restriction system protein